MFNVNNGKVKIKKQGNIEKFELTPKNFIQIVVKFQ